jgi:uncharacterized protein YacL
MHGRLDRVARFLVVGGLIGIVLVGLLLERFGGLTAEVAAGVLVYAFLCELYIFLFTMTISSISSNLLVRLAQREMTLSEVGAAYDSESMVTGRLARLVSTGFLQQSDDLLSITLKGLRFVRSMNSLRKFFGHR